MDINWYGFSCFRLRERGVTAICDPLNRKATGIQLPRIRADIVTISSGSSALAEGTDGVSGEPKILRGPGDYEVKQVLVTGLPTSQNGTRNVAFFLDFAGLTVGHLGELGQVPASAGGEELGDIDVLLAPVSGPHVPDVSRIAEVISQLDPRIVVPMQYSDKGIRSEQSESLEPVDRFLKELGISDPEVADTLRLTKSGLPEETQVVLLRPTGTARPG
ncbi:MAG: MBL fold metallo-hydrolase [Caldilineaceae bacterium SB0668_bin_21]|nr:MBL fold metallo-hydrolase [Caldilineaceae bacterium SB0668_bin_21]MYC23971.1 MBL fold metallo-hydrolase [Caldilineaceae bacterium SB0662_bin_25]